MSRKEQLTSMLVKEPDDPFLHFGLAMELVKEGSIDEAMTCFDRVNELDPDYAPAYFHRGNTLISVGRLAEAQSVLSHGIEAARKAGNEHALSEMQGLFESIPAG